jgi:hypothetical protein
MDSTSPTRRKKRHERKTEMKRTITTLALAATMLLTAAPAAFATHVDGESQDTAGHGTTECRPGADTDLTNGLIGSWTPITMEEYIAEYFDRTGRELPEERAQATWDFCDKNRDGTVCVLRTEPSPYYWTLLDNRPFSGSGPSR